LTSSRRISVPHDGPPRTWDVARAVHHLCSRNELAEGATRVALAQREVEHDGCQARSRLSLGRGRLPAGSLESAAVQRGQQVDPTAQPTPQQDRENSRAPGKFLDRARRGGDTSCFVHWTVSKLSFIHVHVLSGAAALWLPVEMRAHERESEPSRTLARTAHNVD
jgi:hypothetical protein